MKEIIFLLLVGITSSCYRMPEEGEVSMIPNVNNPNVVKQQGQAPLAPGFEY